VDVLDIIRKAGPPGIGATDLAESLLIQIEGTDEDAVIQKLLVTFHLEDIRSNRLPKISKDTGRPIGEIKTAIEHLARLTPRPGEDWSTIRTRYVVPDLEVKYVEGRYEVAPQDTFLPAIRVNSYYKKMLDSKDADSKVLKYVRGKVSAADWLISSLEQRRDTLQRIGNEIVRVQKDFFEDGVSGLKPLRMQDVADAVGVHVATVSRAAAGKYVDTPRGVYPPKFFFSGGLETSGGGVQARRSVEEEMRTLIDAEDKRHPLNDGEIVKKMKEKGIAIARRTVAKYRGQLGIQAGSLRKEH
jgi:RNA polymerase sigma-54 factor